MHFFFVCKRLLILLALNLQCFFALRYLLGGNFYVSENLKQEIKNASCTTIEFQPIELSYDEWSAPSGEREKIYGKT